MMRLVTEAAAKGKTALVRVDFNVPLRNGRVVDDMRIRRALPTIRLLLGRGARVVLVSHLGRPRGAERTLSLRPVAKRLSKLVRQKVYFLDGHPDVARYAISRLPRNALVLLENIRFYKGEEANSPAFARALASCADFYVSDAFGVSHRKAASLVQITRYIPSYVGLLLRDELRALDKIRRAKKHPFVLILGGVKLKDKLPLIERFLGKADAILTGGGVANTLLKAKGVSVGRSLYEAAVLRDARRLLKNKRVEIPADSKSSAGRILDIGPETTARYAAHVRRARMVLWNGPLGLIEDSRFRGGTRVVARAIARNRRAFSVVGGGDTAAFVHSLGLASQISFLSTGGGAMLEYLAGMKLPAIEALKSR